MCVGTQTSDRLVTSPAFILPPDDHRSTVHRLEQDIQDLNISLRRGRTYRFHLSTHALHMGEESLLVGAKSKAFLFTSPPRQDLSSPDRELNDLFDREDRFVLSPHVASLAPDGWGLFLTTSWPCECSYSQVQLGGAPLQSTDLAELN